MDNLEVTLHNIWMTLTSERSFTEPTGLTQFPWARPDAQTQGENYNYRLPNKVMQKGGRAGNFLGENLKDAKSERICVSNPRDYRP